jgi:hypothetical protein
MKVKAKRAVLLSGLSLLLIFALLTAVFFLRKPAFLVSDELFSIVYGRNRLTAAQVSASLRVFRRIKLITVADAVGPDGVVLAVSGAAKDPYCVIFPYRFRSGGEAYFREFPEIPTVVLLEGDEVPKNAVEGLRYLPRDREGDLYRAGRAAAALAAGETAACYLSQTGKLRQAFTRGLEDGGNTAQPLFLDPRRDQPFAMNPGVVVIAGTTELYFTKALEIPVVLFTWMEPRIIPDQVKAVFDDSPIALSAQAVSLAGKTEGAAQARLKIFGRRINDKKIASILKKI